MKRDDEVFIREMKVCDVEALIKTFCFPWSTMEKTLEKWTGYSTQHQKNIRTVYLLEKQGQIIGYASLLRVSEYPDFKSSGIPEINDLWVSQAWRNKGFGKMSVLHLEEIARMEGYKQIGLGVGLYKDYGAAQILYFKLGYLPDGKGITHQGVHVVTGKHYPVDDDLILWLCKPL